MRIVIMGTGGFAVPTFELLLGTSHEIVAVVTMPIRNTRSSKKMTTPVRSVANAAGIEIFDPENINDPVYLTTFEKWDADLLFACDYGKILAKHLLASTKYGGINLHGSLLPKYRGAAPINRALLNGEPTVGVSVIHMTPELDAGPVIAMSSPLSVLPHDTAIEVEEKLAKTGAELVLRVLPQFQRGTLNAILQQNELATKAPKLKKEEGQINWHDSAQQIVWQYQALQPWPRIFTDWYPQHAEANTPPIRLILGCVRCLDAEVMAAIMPDVSLSDHRKKTPGTVIVSENAHIVVVTGNGFLQIDEMQPAGRNMISADAFLRGYPLKSGDQFA